MINRQFQWACVFWLWFDHSNEYYKHETYFLHVFTVYIPMLRVSQMMKLRTKTTKLLLRWSDEAQLSDPNQPTLQSDVFYDALTNKKRLILHNQQNLQWINISPIWIVCVVLNWSSIFQVPDFLALLWLLLTLPLADPPPSFELLLIQTRTNIEETTTEKKNSIKQLYIRGRKWNDHNLT